MSLESIELDLVSRRTPSHADSTHDQNEEFETNTKDNDVTHSTDGENSGTNNKKKTKDIIHDKCIKENFSLYSTFHGYHIRQAFFGEKIQKGLRVMTPLSWKPPDSYSFDDLMTIGTVSDVTKEGIIKVLWDPADNIQDFKKSPRGQYDLLLYDNAQIGVKHRHVQCSCCLEYPLRGIRWKCANCTRYNLCTICYMYGFHKSTGHKFKRIQSENAKSVQLNTRKESDVIRAHAIKKMAGVQLRTDETCTGSVTEKVGLLNHKFEAFRSDAIVLMNDNEIRFSVGRTGHCDLKFKIKGKGLSYYEDHLPIVSSDTAMIGTRVVRGPAWDNNDDDGGHGFVGTIIHFEENSTEENSSISEQTPGSQQLKTQVHVQWDNGTKSHYSLQQLRILDNGPSGVEHELFFCDICEIEDVHDNCIRGIRWRCADCDDYDLCSKCYMKDKHDKQHKFIRFVVPTHTLREKKDSVFCRENGTRKQSYGIFKGAYVVAENDENESGTVLKICDCKIDTGRSKVEVWWREGDLGIRQHDFLELKYVDNYPCCYYPDHLPSVGAESRGHFDVDFVFDGEETTKKIKVTIWRKIKQERKESYKPNMLIIFADHPELDKTDEKQQNEDKTERLVDEVMEFAKRTKLPCHVVGKKIMFYNGSSNSVFIHYRTEKNVIQELVKRGFRHFERGDVEENQKDEEDEIHYFKRMTEYVYGETILPVVISLRKGGLRTLVMQSAVESKIPIICLKKHTRAVTVLTPEKYTKNNKSIKMTAHITDVKTPCIINKSEAKVYKIGHYDNKDDPYEIALISECSIDCKDHLDALICYLIIGVSMYNDRTSTCIYGEYTDVYQNALSMYLLKKGKWTISKDNIKKSFSQRSIEYIYEQDLLSDFKDGLWLDLERDTNMAYTPPTLRKPNEKEDNDSDGNMTDISDSDNSETDDENFDDDNSRDDEDPENDDGDAKDDEDAEKNDGDTKDDDVVGEDNNNDDENDESDEDTRNTNDNSFHARQKSDVTLNVSISELYGLIFIALLQNQYWKGAKQLIETGCIRIHHVLIGCVILENVATHWKTAPLLKERLLKLKGAFTLRAIRILSCIYDADNKAEIEKKIKSNEKEKKEKNIYAADEDEEELELGDHINHAGRLLLNHGYIGDAIKTHNKTFLDNNDVKNIINKMWYGQEQLNSKRIVVFIGLALCHIIILPLLMISMETRPLLWLYKQYKLPFMKVFIHLLGFLTLLVAYAYMLLFDFIEDGISYTDYFIIIWMMSFFVDENKQHIIAIIRNKWRSYTTDSWNRLDWLSMMVYTLGMILKCVEISHVRDAAKVFLVVAFMLLCIRILNLFCMSEILGPKLVMIRKMFSDTFAFMIIMTVIMMCYNISFHALLYNNSEFSWSQIEQITKNGYWMLFGELNLDAELVTIPDCIMNRTLFETSSLPICPSQLGLYLVPYLKAFYGLIAVILLLNLLIAMYSYTFQEVQEQSEFYWSQLQNNFLEEYSIKTVFPIHLQLLALPITITHACIWICKRLHKTFSDDDFMFFKRNSVCKDDATLNHCPMFVRVFLYNTNFDLNLKSTREAEGNGALEAKGEIDTMETDRITKLQEKLDSNTKELYKISEKNNKNNQKMLARLMEITDILKNRKESVPSPTTAKMSIKADKSSADLTTSDDEDFDSQLSSSDEY